jgi:hypothetical protein
MSKPKCQLFEDVYEAVYGDSMMWVVIWGEARCSKSTLAGWILYSLYKDWHMVLDAFGYSITEIMHKLINGIPARFPTRNQLHMRVPALNFDDFGSNANKASTQHDIAWDTIKGTWDLLGTRLGVLCATMLDPSEATQQLQRYTHEVHCLGKGHYKYDKVIWEQDFRGWRTRPKKIFIEENTFDKWPDEIYRQYDDRRQSLCDEAFIRIQDMTVLSQLDFVMRMSKPLDFEIMQLIDTQGPIDNTEGWKQFGDEGKLAVTRMKARSLIMPVQKTKGNYRLELTPLGKSVLDKHSSPTT